LRNGGLSGKLKCSFSNQYLWLVDSEALRNPPLRKAENRYAQLKKSQPHKQHIWFLPTRKPTQKKPKELFFANAR
jgi:hypothetical protein